MSFGVKISSSQLNLSTTFLQQEQRLRENGGDPRKKLLQAQNYLLGQGLPRDSYPCVNHLWPEGGALALHLFVKRL